MVLLARLGREEGVVGKALVRGRRHPGGVLVAARHAVAVDQAAVSVRRGGRGDQALGCLRGLPEVAPVDGGGSTREGTSGRAGGCRGRRSAPGEPGRGAGPASGRTSRSWTRSQSLERLARITRLRIAEPALECGPERGRRAGAVAPDVAVEANPEPRPCGARRPGRVEEAALDLLRQRSGRGKLPEHLHKVRARLRV